MKRGILTIAQGSMHYIEMAITLAMSLKLKCPDMPIAVVTDSEDERLKVYFDHIIPINPSYGFALEQKLHILDYSPFEETIYLDSDILIVSPVYFLFDLFKGHDVSTSGGKIMTGEWAGMNVPSIMQRYNIKYLINLNGGLFYFVKSETAQKVFNKAIALLKEYKEIGAILWRGKISDEPLMSIAMSIYEQEPIDDNGKGMRTPLGLSGQFKMDILKGYCRFYKYEKLVTPSIMHYGGFSNNIFFYRREIIKLKMNSWKIFPPSMISFIVNSCYNPFYISFIFVYRASRFFVKGIKFKLLPLMPMFRFE